MGIRVPLQGKIQFEDEGEGFAAVTPSQVRGFGAALIPADRYRRALGSSLSVEDNFCIGGVRARQFGRWLSLNKSAMAKETSRAIKEFDIQGVRHLAQKLALLSGGNDQKLVIDREFDAAPRIVIAQSPSRGLDARATSAVHARLAQARDTGAAVLLISEDLDEILALSDRIGVMVRGRVAAEFAAPFDRSRVGQAMIDHV